MSNRILNSPTATPAPEAEGSHSPGWSAAGEVGGVSWESNLIRNPKRFGHPMALFLCFARFRTTEVWHLTWMLIVIRNRFADCCSLLPLLIGNAGWTYRTSRGYFSIWETRTPTQQPQTEEEPAHPHCHAAHQSIQQTSPMKLNPIVSSAFIRPSLL